MFVCIKLPIDALTPPTNLNAAPYSATDGTRWAQGCLSFLLSLVLAQLFEDDETVGFSVFLATPCPRRCRQSGHWK
jgi:hypothetical protein